MACVFKERRVSIDVGFDARRACPVVVMVAFFRAVKPQWLSVVLASETASEFAVLYFIDLTS